MSESTFTGNSNHGFTLVEILFVVLIIGILLVVGYSSLTQWIPAYTLRDATQTLYGDLRQSKLYAIKSNKTVTFTFTGVANAANCPGPSGYTLTDSDGQVVASQTFDDSICLFSSTFINGTSGFDPRGFQAEDPPAQHSVKLKHIQRDRDFEIVQSSAGSISIL